MTDPDTRVRGGRLTMPRSRGALSGLLLILLGVWGALVPFVGPNFDFAYSLGGDWTVGRGWLEVLPGVVAVVGGVLLLTSRNRISGMLGGWLAVAAGAWFVVGRAFAGPLGLGDVGTPVADTDTKRVWLELSYFYGLGAVIVFLGAFALGRMSVRSIRDVEIVKRAPAQGPLDRDTVAAHPTGAAGPVMADGTTNTTVTGREQRRGGLRNMLRGRRRDRTPVDR